MTQHTLFDTSTFDNSLKLAFLRQHVKLIQEDDFSIDTLQKLSKIYRVSCNVVWDIYEEELLNEKFSKSRKN